MVGFLENMNLDRLTPTHLIHRQILVDVIEADEVLCLPAKRRDTGAHGPPLLIIGSTILLDQPAILPESGRLACVTERHRIPRIDCRAVV